MIIQGLSNSASWRRVLLLGLISKSIVGTNTEVGWIAKARHLPLPAGGGDSQVVLESNWSTHCLHLEGRELFGRR